MKIIFNGDDFGITKACNYAIVDCFKDGVLRSTSMMMNMPAVEHAIALMKEYPDLSVGIHFCLTAGYPLTKGLKTIVKEDGSFNKGILKNGKGVDVAELRTEIYAQFNRFVELVGKLPTHINSHHGIEQIPGAEAIVLELSNTYHLPIRRFFTLPEGNHPNCEFFIPPMCAIFKEDWSQPIYPEEIIDFFTKEMLESDEIFEVPAHPGYVDYDLMQISSLTNGRCYDAYNFTCTKIMDWVKENNITLCSYEDIPLKNKM